MAGSPQVGKEETSNSLRALLFDKVRYQSYLVEIGEQKGSIPFLLLLGRLVLSHMNSFINT